MKKYLCLVVMFLTTLSAIAQEVKELKIVQLKNGTYITGYVTNNTDGSISIITIDGDQLFYQSAEVKTIELLEKPEKQKKSKTTKSQVGISMKEKGFQFSIELAAGDGDDGWEYVGVEQIKVIPSYRFNKNFLLGAAIGLISYYGGEWQDWNNQHRYNYSGLSLEAVAQYDFVNRTRFMPYVGGNIGGSTHDLIIGADAGILFRLTHKGGPYLGFLFEYIRDVETLGIKAGWAF